jgi:hypothetical protein
MTDLATLGLAIDSSPAAQAASDLDRLTASAVKVERAVNETGNAADRAGKKMAAVSSATKQMEAAINGTVHANDNAVGAINRHVAAINKLTEAERRLSSSFGRGQDIAAYGAELDRLRGKFNPLFATIQQYKTAQAEIREAHSVGAISASEMTAAIRRERQATLASIASLKGRATSLRQVAAAERSVAGARGFETANIAAQFQDIGVTAAMGMNPLQIALQQGTQLASVLNSMDRPLAGLIGGFGSLLSMTSLLTIALIAVGAAALQWLFSAKDDADKLDDALENHTKTVGHLTKLYGEAAAAAENLASAGGEAFSFASIRNDAETLRNVLKMQQQVMAQSLSGDGWLSNMLGGTGASLDMLRNLTGDQIKFKAAVDSFLESVRRGDGDLDSFRQNVETIFSTLLNTSENPTELRATADAVLAIGESATTVSGKFAPFSDAINKLMLEFSEGKNGVVEFNREVSRIGAQDPSLQKIADEAIVLGQNINKVTEALKEMERARFRATEQVRDRLASERNDTGQSYYQERERQWELENRILDAQTKQVQALTDQERIAAAGDVARARNPVEGEERRREIAVAERQERERLDQQARESAIDRAREREEAIRGAQEEMELIGKTAGEVAKLQFEYAELAKLREESARTGRDIDQQEIDAIRQKSEEMGRYAEQIAAARAMDDILFEREQMGRTREEQEVYSTIRRLGLDINSSEGQRIADGIRINEQLEEQKKLATELAGIFAGLFSSPIKGADDFFNRLLNGFAKIGEANIQKAFEGLLSGGIGKSTGGSGFLDQIGDFVGDIFTSRKMTQQQNKAIDTAAAKIPAEPLVQAMEKVGGAVTKTTGTVASSIGNYAAAIRKIESGSYQGNYGAMGPVTKSGDRAYGAYQVMGNNIPSWTKELLGQSVSVKDFLQDKGLQDRVFYQQFGKSLDKFGNFSDAASVWFSGQPLSVARNRSDGFNTTEQYVQKATNALGNIKTDVSVGAEVGVSEGLKKAATANLSAPPASPAAPQAGMSTGTLQQGIGAALGGFGIGQQTQSPIMGGIGGAISGFMAGGPIGAVIGGIAGVIGGIFGNKQKKKEEQKARDAAKQTLAENQAAINQMFAIGEGRGYGDVTRSVYEFQDETHKLSDLAKKADDNDLIRKLQDNFNKFFLIVERDFIAVLPGMLEAYSAGFGSDSAFVQGKREMEELRQELKDFIADVQDFGDLQLKHNRALTPQMLAERVAEAERAAQKMALATVSGTEKLSAMQEEMLRLDGLSATLQQTLEELGMSAKMAADAIDGALGVAMAKLRDTFSKTLNSSINDLSDFGYLNEIADAQAVYQERLRDASALGMDGSLALRELSLSIKDIASTANLSKEELALLSDAFPELRFMFNGIAADALTLTEATSQLQAAYDKEAAAINEVIDRTKNFITSIKQFREAMKINDTSPLGPKERLDEAAKQFRDLAAKAGAGDEEAMGQLTQISQAYLDEARSYYASSEAYFEIWKEVDRTLEKTQGLSQENMNTAEQQLKALNASVDGIISVNDSVLSVKDALDQYNAINGTTMEALRVQLAAMAANGRESITAAYQNSLGRDPEAAGMAYWQSQLNSGVSLDNVIAGIGNSREAQIVSAYKQILGITPTQASVQALVKSGKPVSAIEEDFKLQKYTMELDPLYRKIFGRGVDTASAQYWRSTGKSMEQIEADLAYAKSVGAFANGGLHSGGLRIVGERGPELEATGPSRIWSASQTRAMLQPANGNSDLLAEVKGLRQDNAEMRAELRSLKQTVAMAGSQQIEEQKKTNANLADVGGELKRANAR